MNLAEIAQHNNLTLEETRAWLERLRQQAVKQIEKDALQPFDSRTHIGPEGPERYAHFHEVIIPKALEILGRDLEEIASPLYELESIGIANYSWYTIASAELARPRGRGRPPKDETKKLRSIYLTDAQHAAIMAVVRPDEDFSEFMREAAHLLIATRRDNPAGGL